MLVSKAWPFGVKVWTSTAFESWKTKSFEMEICELCWVCTALHRKGSNVEGGKWSMSILLKEVMASFQYLGCFN